jgi:glycosyltransferase involved in cell wall biosynthesis
MSFVTGKWNSLKVVWVAGDADRAGAGGELLRLLKSLPKGRFSVTVTIRHDARTLALDLQHEGAVALDLGDPGVPPARGFVAATAAVHRLKAILEELAPSIVHGFDEESSALAALAGRMTGVPILVGSLRGHGSAPGWRRRAALRRLDRIVVPSEAVSAEVAASLRCRHPPLAIVPPGVEAREVVGRARAPEFSEPRPRVGTIARLAKDSGIEALIEAASALSARIPDLEWLVAGTGPDAIAYLRAARIAGLEHCFRLLGDREDAGPFLAALDAYVEPGGPDALPSGLLQALAAGVPSVAVRNPTLDAAFAGGPGPVLVDAGGLVESVACVLSDSEGPLRASLRAAGPLAARPFGADASASALVALYESLVSERDR